MNKILVTNNKLVIDDDRVVIEDNILLFKENGNYEIEYIDSDNINLNIVIDKEKNIKLFEYSDNDKVIVSNKYILNDNSNLVVYKFYNINNVDEKIIFDLNGKGSKIDYHFSNICIGNEEYNIVINHNKANTYSNVTNRSIAINGKIDFTIDSVLPKGSKDCVLDQDTKIINLGDNYSTIRPNMFIDLDDVEARHGSVIGKFSEDELFYLMSRGIKYNDCIKLLVKGYLLSNLVLEEDDNKKIIDIINSYWR